MASINRVLLAGNLTRDPVVRFLAGDKAVANFGIAVNERWKDKDGVAKESVVFVDVEAWGRTAELIGQYLTKGRACFVEGRLRLDSWEKDGAKQTKLKVVADNVQFLDSKREAPGADAREPARTVSSNPPPPAVGDDEPPF